MIRSIFFLFLCCMAFPALAAAVPEWRVLKEQSVLRFQARYAGAAVKGEFRDFDVNLRFDPANLNRSEMTVTVRTADVISDDASAGQEVKTSSWLGVDAFPTARFVTKEFRKSDDTHFEARGTLTLKGVSKDIAIPFTLAQYDATKGAGNARAEGKITLKRREFSVGEGEWQSVATVADEVEVSFAIAAKMKE